VLDGVDVIAPMDNLIEVHDAYVAMATAGAASAAQREVFLRTGKTLVESQGCETIMLAGTDLALVFKKDNNFGFHTVDCAKLHAQAIAVAAMASVC
jgi:aspartate racemase